MRISSFLEGNSVVWSDQETGDARRGEIKAYEDGYLLVHEDCVERHRFVRLEQVRYFPDLDDPNDHGSEDESEDESEDVKAQPKEKGPRALEILRCIQEIAGTQLSNAITANMISSQLDFRGLDKRMKRIAVQFGTTYNREGEIRAHGMIMTDERKKEHRYFINPVMATQVEFRLESE